MKDLHRQMRQTEGGQRREEKMQLHEGGKKTKAVRMMEGKQRGYNKEQLLKKGHNDLWGKSFTS